MQTITLTQGYPVMITNSDDKPDFSRTVRETLAKDPGLSVKELAERLKTNRQFMAGVLKVLEQRGEVSYRQVGPARIYFVKDKMVN
jgi:predicted transcriptional regulator